MDQGKLSLWIEAAALAVADWVLAILGLLLLLAPYAILLVIAFSGLFLPLPSFLPRWAMWLFTAIIAGILHIQSFDRFVVPHILNAAGVLAKANSAARGENWARRAGIKKRTS